MSSLVDRWQQYLATRTIGDDRITCPFCGFVDHEAWDGGYPQLGEDAVEVECRSETCGRTFLLSMHQVFRSEKPGGDDDAE